MIKQCLDFLKYTKITKKKNLFCTSQSTKQQKNKLIFIYLTSTLGGAILGASISSYLFYYYFEDKDQHKSSKKDKNFLQLTAKWNEDWDGLQKVYQDKQDKQKKLGTKYITMIRHGQYVLDKEKDKRVLTMLGRQQAQLVGERLLQLDQIYDKIYVSDMVRAKETCDIVRKYFPKAKIIEDPRLAEGRPSIVYPEHSSVNKKVQKIMDKDMPRISGAFQSYFKRCESEQDEKILFIIHCNVIRYYLCRVLQFPVEGWLRFSIFNTGISQLKIKENGHVSVTSIGDVGHLKYDQITFH